MFTEADLDNYIKARNDCAVAAVLTDDPATFILYRDRAREWERLAAATIIQLERAGA